MRKPDFMERRKKKPPPPPEDSDSDKDWTPAVEQPKEPRRMSKGVFDDDLNGQL